MVTKQMIENAKVTVINRQSLSCIICNCGIDISATSSYCYVSKINLSGRYKFSDVEQLELHCMTCFRLSLAEKTKGVYAKRKDIKINNGFITCKDCNETKPLQQFRKNSRGSYRSQCKTCNSLKSKQARLSNIELYREKQRLKHRVLMQESESYRNSKRLSSAKTNKKKDWSKYTRTKSELLRQERLNNLIGHTCALYLTNCYVCGNLACAKSNKFTRCKDCKINRRTKCYNLVQYECLICKCEFKSTKSSSGVCYKCQRKKRKRSPNQSGKKKSFDERAKKYNVVYEKINANDIYKRDGFKCVSCGCKVVKSDTYRPDQATIDHVIPMSKGGSHTIDNIVTMCHTCNSIKRDSLITGRQIGLFCKVN